MSIVCGRYFFFKVTVRGRGRGRLELIRIGSSYLLLLMMMMVMMMPPCFIVVVVAVVVGNLVSMLAAYLRLKQMQQLNKMVHKIMLTLLCVCSLLLPYSSKPKVFPNLFKPLPSEWWGWMVGG